MSTPYLSGSVGALVSQYATANGTTSSPTTTSGTPAVIPQMTVTLTTQGRHVFVSFSGSFNLQHNDSFDLQVYQDGVAVAGTLRRVNFIASTGALVSTGSIPGFPVALVTLIPLVSAGSHTFDVRWSVAGGTARARLAERRLTVHEVL